MRFAVAIVLFSCFLVGACGGGSLGPGQGAEGGPCYPNGTCDDGLVCLSDLCVEEPDCDPNDTESCYCLDLSEGQRTCDENHLWGECVCDDPCGDGVCDVGETHENCPADCPGDDCGDGVCDAGETFENCPEDCPADPCGNGVCDVGETFASCPADCPADICGNGAAETGEDCDGDDLAGLGCSDLGFTDGVLGCLVICTFDTSGCTSCGNDVAEGGAPGMPGYEECDGVDLRSETCATLGQPVGVLDCDAGCAFDLTGCTGTLPVTLEGTVWSPGADQSTTLQANRFPIPNVLVVGFSAPPAVLPASNSCAACPQAALTDPYTYSDPVNGTFSLQLDPGTTVYLTVWSGFFRRVRQVQVPNTPGGTFTLEDPVIANPRPVQTTLPNTTDLALGDNIPRIAVINATYEDQTSLWNNLGFGYGTEIDEIPETSIQALLTTPATLAQYNMLIVPAGENFPAGAITAAAVGLRTWVEAGGTLFADDFNYDFVEQPFPEFLAWFDGNVVCGDGPTPPATVGQCNNWTSYDFMGNAGTGDFASWVALPGVIGAGTMVFENAWNYLASMAAGEVGWDAGTSTPILQAPDVWLTNSDTTPLGTDLPVMVSWPYYCGKVIYSIPLIHDFAAVTTELTLQEKVFINLIVGARGC